MKKIVTLVLAIALLMTSVVAIAENHATPNISSFATMKVKYDEGNRLYTITLSKPVDRLLINWTDKGSEPEELAVGEDLKATAIAWSHKYMPGTTQKQATSTYTYKRSADGKIDPKTSDYAYSDYKLDGSMGGARAQADYITYGPKFTIKADTVTDTNAGLKIKSYTLKYTDKNGAEQTATFSTLDAVKSFYSDKLGIGGNVKVTAPKAIADGTYKDEFGNVAGNKVKEYLDGSITSESLTRKINTKYSTVSATPAQTAFMTVQGEWAVYYNRAGKIVGIEYFDGQF